ncbi:hypothetical protein HY632_05405 [Candidatus Uhrbacteria bacterium]|nr:hypothetical protein [Candidatus Uhrbacteria bacterium]
MSNLPNPIATRDALLQERGWTLLSVFDTNAHEPFKDVSRVRTATGAERILRIGERRPPEFFPNGYSGTHIVIPKLHESSEDPCFELEELLPGTLLSAIEPVPTAHMFVRPDLLTECIEGFWELSWMFPTQPLAPKWRREEKLLKHFAGARTLLTAEEHHRIMCVLMATQDFWNSTHAAKWKYSLDNIILLPDQRLGLIDLARVGTYFWGYDLGWLLWSRWFHLPLEALQHPEMHLRAIERYFAQIIALAPSGETQLPHGAPHHLHHRLALVLLERIIGAFFDVAESIAHTRSTLATPERRDAFVAFLHALLAWTLPRCTGRS